MPPATAAQAVAPPNQAQSSEHAPKIVPKRKPATPFAVKPIGAFYVFLFANILAALFAPIQDCDETFNYWEPTHYLSRGYGLQTWEYSPDYAIRSWLYVAIHALIGSLRRLLPFSSKLAEFYFIRYVLGFICALAQTWLFRVVNNTLNPRIALFFLMAQVLSPGMFHASAAFLPSSFTMYTTMAGMACFMNWRGGIKTSQAMAWFAVGGALGWPFAAALCFPFIVEEVIFACLAPQAALGDWVMRMIRGTVAGALAVGTETVITSFFYRKLEVVPWNIVKYNIFGGEGKGPEIYGTEPWYFYFQNLLLNFNIWFVLALFTLPLFILKKIFGSARDGAAIGGLRTIIFMSPFYMWLTIFSFQPHKEERFMYPAYPCLALNAALSFHIILAALGNADPKTLIGKIPARIKLIIVASAVIGSIDIGVARIFGMYNAYSAPIRVLEPLQNSTIGGYGESVCYGKEWYRFPSSYHLPNEMKAKFVKSEFDGLLPGEFATARTGFGFWSGTWLTPAGMNDRNEEDTGKYVDLRTCSFMVDTYYPDAAPTRYEPHYILDTETWDKVKCVPFMDAAKTHIVARTMWIPDLPFIDQKYKRKWGEHCLLKRKRDVKRKF